jgi:phenylacetate-coenzyme A ligase PaaK-like adenylate-forming protein
MLRSCMMLCINNDGSPGDDIIGKFLVLTIKNALRQPFYQSLWADIDTDVIGEPADISVLPCVTKQMYHDDYMTSFDHSLSHYLSHSSGTTGALTFRHRSHVEEVFIRWLLSPSEAPDRDPRVGIRLMTGPMHGMQMPVSGGGVSIPAATGTVVQLQQCIELLTTSFHLHGRSLRPSHLSGQSIDVALVAQALRAHSIEPSSLPLREITLMGPVDEGLRQFLNRSFDVPLRERYSTSEVFGGAVREPGLDHFVTDPFVIAEVCDDQGRALDDGAIGQLTMTELYPFVQIQPLIRYCTGDLVERVASPSPGRISFRYLGRLEQSVWLKRPDREDVVFTDGPLADALGGLPMITRWRAYGDIAANFPNVGKPIVELFRPTESQVGVRVGVSVDPFLYPRAAQEIVDCIWDTLSPPLAPDDDIELIVELSRYDPGQGFGSGGGYRTLQTVGPHRLAGDRPRVA